MNYIRNFLSDIIEVIIDFLIVFCVQYAFNDYNFPSVTDMAYGLAFLALYKSAGLRRKIREGINNG